MYGCIIKHTNLPHFNFSLLRRLLTTDSGSPGKIGAASAKTIANGLQNYPSPLGRYGAPRPPCSMGQVTNNNHSITIIITFYVCYKGLLMHVCMFQIIHNQSPTVTQVQESARWVYFK